MRTMNVLFAALALAAAPACKNQTEKQSDRVESARKEVEKQNKEMVEARRDVNKQQRDVDKAHQDLADAKIAYQNVVKDRLARIDQKIESLSGRTDQASRDEAQQLRMRRDELSRRLETANTTGADAWDAFRKDIDDQMKKLEDDADAATKRNETPTNRPATTPPATTPPATNPPPANDTYRPSK